MKTLLFLLPLIFPDPVPSPSPSPSPAPSIARVLVGPDVQVKIYTTGDVWMSPATKLPRAAQTFWEFVSDHNPLRAELEHLRAENARLKRVCGKGK